MIIKPPIEKNPKRHMDRWLEKYTDRRTITEDKIYVLHVKH